MLRDCKNEFEYVISKIESLETIVDVDYIDPNHSEPLCFFFCFDFHFMTLPDGKHHMPMANI